jgi:hypothetical protein
MNGFIDFVVNYKEFIALGLIAIGYGVIKYRKFSKTCLDKSLAGVLDEIVDYSEDHIDEIVDKVYSVIPFQYKIFVSKKFIKASLLKALDKVEDVVDGKHISAEGIDGEEIKINPITKG